MTHLCFQQHLILSLSAHIRTEPVPHRSHVHQSLERLQHPQQAHHLERGTKRKDCVVCSDRQGGGTRHLTFFFCASCTDKPSLCPTGCFHTYHTQRNYQQ